jgi:hypothetical protein
MVAVPLGPAPVDITGVRAGDLNEFQITLLSGGSKMNVTDMTFNASARVTKADTGHLDAVVTIVDGPNGIIMVRWPGDAVRTWLGTNVTQKGVWDLELINGTDDPLTVCAGDFSAELDVTHTP